MYGIESNYDSDQKGGMPQKIEIPHNNKILSTDLKSLLMTSGANYTHPDLKTAIETHRKKKSSSKVFKDAYAANLAELEMIVKKYRTIYSANFDEYKTPEGFIVSITGKTNDEFRKMNKNAEKKLEMRQFAKQKPKKHGITTEEESEMTEAFEENEDETKDENEKTKVMQFLQQKHKEFEEIQRLSDPHQQSIELDNMKNHLSDALSEVKSQDSKKSISSALEDVKELKARIVGSFQNEVLDDQDPYATIEEPREKKKKAMLANDPTAGLELLRQSEEGDFEGLNLLEEVFKSQIADWQDEERAAQKTKSFESRLANGDEGEEISHQIRASEPIRSGISSMHRDFQDPRTIQTVESSQRPSLEQFIQISGAPAEINLQDFMNAVMNRKEQERGVIDNQDPSDIVDATIIYTRFNNGPSRKQISKKVSLSTLTNIRPFMSTIYAKNWATMPNFISDAVVSQEGFEMIADFLGAPLSLNAIRIDSIWGGSKGKTFTLS
jgi:hypothetical protein